MAWRWRLYARCPVTVTGSGSGRVGRFGIVDPQAPGRSAALIGGAGGHHDQLCRAQEAPIDHPAARPLALVRSLSVSSGTLPEDAPLDPVADEQRGFPAVRRPPSAACWARGPSVQVP